MKRKRTEQRMLPLDIELRAGEGEQAGQLVGHAAVFNQWSTISEPFFGELWQESVAPGAYKKTIQEADIRALWNHDPNIVLGRAKAGTLSLAEDETGLAVTITPPDSEWGRPVVEAVRRGDVSGMSIAFQVVKEEWTSPDRKKDPKALRQRVIREAKLLDVSPVTFPAFPQTDISARNDDAGDADSSLLRAFRAARLAEIGLPLEADERAELRQAAAYFERVSGEPASVGADEAPSHADHSPEAQDAEPDVRAQIHSEAARARRLQLIKLSMEV